MENLSPRVTDWLNTRCESEKSKSSYIYAWHHFETFCNQRGKDPNRIVDEYRAIKYEGETKRESFIDDWQDLLRAFAGWLKPKMASLSFKQCLTAVKSYLRFWKIPLDVDLPRHPFVTYHNRDIRREEVKRILTFATPRDRVLYLVLAESGMRSDTAVNLKYEQIKEDFEAKRIPMKILLPSSTLKDHVGDRWTFIGEDGFRELSNYLAQRLPLKDDEYVFISEKQGLVKGEQFSAASLSVKFNRIVQKLGISESLGAAGKPKRIRLHGLRKYFRNNMKADSAFVNFWMGHSLGVDSHYISRDPEDHRQRYSEGYKSLRIFESTSIITESKIEELKTELATVTSKLQEKDAEIKELRQMIQPLVEILKLVPKHGELDLVARHLTSEEEQTEAQVHEEEMKEYYARHPDEKAIHDKIEANAEREGKAKQDAKRRKK